MADNREKLYILCGLAGKGEDDIRNALTEKAEEAGYEAVCVSRYRKAGIRQYIAEHPEFRIVLLQESMQSSYPYTAEELAELMDDYNLNIIVSLSKSHRANQYMKILYTAGILNALYEEDATAANIMNLILYPRTRKICREYYQITTAADILDTLEVVDEQKIQGFLEYIEESDSDDEVIQKYRYVAKSIKIIENIYLARHLSEHVKAILATEDEFQKYLSLHQKKRWRPFGKRKVHSRERPLPEHGKPQARAVQQEMRSDREEVQKEDRNNVEEMVDEDISDLLGFGSEERVFDTQEFYPEVLSEQEKQTDETKPKKQRKTGKQSALIKAAAVFGVMIFLAGIILFGFFLIAEYQASREETPPVISQNTGTDEPDISDQIMVSRSDERPDEEQDDPEIKETEDEDHLAEEETRGDEGETHIENQDTQVAEPKTQAPVQKETPEVSQEQETVPAAPQQNSDSVSISTSQPEPVQETPEAEEQTSYVGKILTGSEVAAAAAAEEQKGAQLYLKTRENGEGYFSASVIAGMVDSTCSYLVEGSDGVHISFIQQ